MPAWVEVEHGAEVEAGDSLGSLLRGSHPKPPVATKGAGGSLLDSGKMTEIGKDRNENPKGLQGWHSQGFEKNYPDMSSVSEYRDGNADFRQKLGAPADKKKGVWGWKPFQAFAHVGQKKYNCLFTVHVHGIEGLPISMNGLRLGVHFAKKDDAGVQTMPARVFKGHAEFQETLNTRCTLHGAKNGAKGMKWETKQFILSVIALDVDELVLGRHKLELTRLLPETIEDDDDKQDSWTTSFKLSGKAQGATLVVTFGCEIQGKDSQNLSATSSARFGESPVLRATRSFNSLPNSGHATPSRYALEPHHSPSTSELSAEHNGMERLSLDDQDIAYGIVKGDIYSDSRADNPEVANIYAYKEPNDNLQAGRKKEEEEEEDELEFSIVDKGVEIGVILDNVSARSYDAFEEEDMRGSEEKHGAEGVNISSHDELYHDDPYQNTGDQYEENEDAKEASPSGAEVDLFQAEQLDKQITEYEDVDTVEHTSKSIDEEQEMEELLAAFVEKTRESDAEGTLTPDYMAEQELLSMLPAGDELDWEAAKRTPQNKMLESDDEFDPVAGEFLSLLASETRPSPVARSDSEPDSPRALLLKQFEKEALIESGLGLSLKMPELPSSAQQSVVPDFYLDGIPSDGITDAQATDDSLHTHQHVTSEDLNNLGWGSDEDVELASIMEAAESELQKATQSMRSKNRAKMLEDAETEALMQEWGLNKKVFEASPRSSHADDTGSPYAMVSCDPPPLGFGLGSEVPTRDGGSLRSMNPANFQGASNSKLVMQVSKPVVVPMDAGAGSLAILQRMAAAGMDGMTDQAMLTMPLDDITGKSVEQIASEGFAAFKGSRQGQEQIGYAASEGGHGQLSLEYTQGNYGAMTAHAGSSLAKTSGGRSSFGALATQSGSRKSNPALGDDTFMSLEDLAPMAMQKIEALALDGLKIQSDMAEEEAPYAVEPLSWQERPAIEGGSSRRQRGGNSFDDPSSMRLLEGGSADSSGMLDDDFSMAISLDEWMRLDAGVVDEDDINGNAMALVATHRATHGDIVPSKMKSSKQGGKQKEDGSNEIGGLMGDTITLAMLVQLRDPLRNFEPVGAPMMALVQAERVVVPPMPKLRLGRRISLIGNNEGYDDEDSRSRQPQFKIREVTLSGVKASDESASDKKQQTSALQIGWGTPKQQQSGSRWLAASGMAKNSKQQSFAKPKAGMPKSNAPNVNVPNNALAFPVTSKSSTTSTTSTKSDSLWSISAKIGSKWGAPTAQKVRNPDVAMPKFGWFGKKK